MNPLQSAEAQTALSGISVGALATGVTLLEGEKIIPGILLVMVGFGLLYFKYATRQ